MATTSTSRKSRFSAETLMALNGSAEAPATPVEEKPVSVPTEAESAPVAETPVVPETVGEEVAAPVEHTAKKRGRPPKKKEEGKMLAVRAYVGTALKAKINMICVARGCSEQDYVAELLRVSVERDYAKAIEKLGI